MTWRPTVEINTCQRGTDDQLCPVFCQLKQDRVFGNVEATNTFTKQFQ